MRASAPFLILLLSLLLYPYDLSGQWLNRHEAARPEVVPPEYTVTLPQLDPGFVEAPSWRSRILTGAGGALAGAFLGFFASEVAVGDWDVQDGAKEPSRSVWAAVGGSIGLAVGFKFPISGDASGPGGDGPLRSGRFTIIAEEIQGASLTNAYDAVSLLHPEWLVQRGATSFTDFGTDNIRVYLNNTQLGGTESLRQVDSSIIESIQFFSALVATARWGAGHPHGVIQVVTSGQ